MIHTHHPQPQYEQPRGTTHLVTLTRTFSTILVQDPADVKITKNLESGVVAKKTVVQDSPGSQATQN